MCLFRPDHSAVKLASFLRMEDHSCVIDIAVGGESCLSPFEAATHLLVLVLLIPARCRFRACAKFATTRALQLWLMRPAGGAGSHTVMIHMCTPAAQSEAVAVCTGSRSAYSRHLSGTYPQVEVCEHIHTLCDIHWC